MQGGKGSLGCQRAKTKDKFPNEKSLNDIVTKKNYQKNINNKVKTYSAISNWEFCSDQQKTFRAIVKIGAIPQFYIIDGKGRIRYSRIGSFDEPSLKTPREVLEMLMGEDVTEK